MSNNLKKIRVCFIGAGPMTRAHALAFKDINNAELVGIYNRTQKKAEVIAQECEIESIYPTIQELYKAGKPDLVVISVYEPAKKHIMELCLSYQIPILCEKPIALNYAESLEICHLAETYACPVWVGLNRRHYSSTLLANNLLNKHQENPRFIEVTDQQDISAAKQLGHTDNVLDNWMFANSIHLVDYFSIFARGKAEKVSILSPWNPIEPSFVSAHIKFTSGDEGLYKAYWNGPGPWSCTVSNKEYFIELKPLEKLKYQYRSSREWHETEGHSWDKNFKSGIRQQAENCINELLAADTHKTNLPSALKSTKLINQIYHGKL